MFTFKTSTSGWVSSKETARFVRQLLKESFPGIKFSVVKDDYSMGASVYVRWDDGPTVKQVDEVLKLVTGKTFDGMTDSYSYHDRYWCGERIHFGIDMVSTNRSMGDETRVKMMPEGMGTPSDARDAVYQKFRETSFTPTTKSATLAILVLSQDDETKEAA